MAWLGLHLAPTLTCIVKLVALERLARQIDSACGVFPVIEEVI